MKVIVILIMSTGGYTSPERVAYFDDFGKCVEAARHAYETQNWDYGNRISFTCVEVKDFSHLPK